MMTITIDNNEDVIMDIDEIDSIDNTESAIVKRLNLSNFGLKSLGDEVHKYLPFLEELDASNNELENVNVCSNLLTKLDCRNNKLSEVNFVQHLPNLEELHISGNSLCLADYYIAATLCPNLKIIDGKAVQFNIRDINKEYNRRLWPQILNLWKTKFDKHFKTKLKDEKSNELIQRFIKQIKSKKLNTQNGFEKFTHFKVNELVDNLITERKSEILLCPPAKTYDKTTSAKQNTELTEIVMSPATTRSKSKLRCSVGSNQHDRLFHNEGLYMPKVRSLKGRHKIAKETVSVTPERKLKHTRKVVEVWPNSACRRRIEEVETNLPPSTIVHTSEVKFAKVSGKNAPKISASKAKKLKIVDDDSASSQYNDDVSSAHLSEKEYSESDISLTTATERALNFIESNNQCARSKPMALQGPSTLQTTSTSHRSRPSRACAQKYQLMRRDDDLDSRKSRIPAPITRSSTRSRTRTSLRTNPTSKIRLRSSPLLLPANKNKECAVSKKESKIDRSDKASQRTTQRPIRSSRTLRNEIAIYNDIENWCEDINEHFLPDSEPLVLPTRQKKVEPRLIPKNTRTILSGLDSHGHARSLRSTVKSSHTRIITKTIPVSSKSSLEKPKKSSVISPKKSKRFRKKLAPLIVSGDEESLDLDPAVNPSALKLKYIEGSDTDSSENLKQQNSSNNSWKKGLSDSDYSFSEDFASETDEEMESLSKHLVAPPPTRWSKRLESKDKDSFSTQRSSRRNNSKTSIKSDDIVQNHRRDLEPRELRSMGRSLMHNSSRINLPVIDFDDPDFCVRNKSKMKSNGTLQIGDTPARRREGLTTPKKYESSETPRTKLADKKSRLSIDERTYSVTSFMEKDWNPLHFLKCHSGDSNNHSIDDDKTQVWHCAFEPDSYDNRSHMVATCGGQTVCLIDCESGRIVNRYRHARSSEEFFTLAWTTLKLDRGKDKNANILAVGGKRGMILLLQPNQLVCYAELSGHKDMISGLNFHGEVPYILCSGSTDGTIIVWDIGIPKGNNYETEWRHIHIIKVQYDVLNVLFVPQVDFLLAGTENSCWGWGFDARRSTVMTKMPSVEFVHPTKVSGTVQMESVVDAIVLVSKNVVASKCAGYKCIYLWDIGATILSTIKKLTRGVRLNIQVLAILQWSDNDNFYLNMGCSRESKILACGDASGKLWIYQLQELLTNKRENPKNQQVVSPVILIDWPECRLKSSSKGPDREVNLNNVVINSVSVSSDACFITAVTDKNIVCIWN